MRGGGGPTARRRRSSSRSDGGRRRPWTRSGSNGRSATARRRPAAPAHRMAGARSIRRRAGRWGRTGNRLADLALATSPAEKTLIEWVARHPLLGAAELAALTGEPGGLIGRRLERLTRCGAIDADAEPPERAGTRHANDVDEPRYLLTELGMRSIAARAGVPPAIYARHGGVDLRLRAAVTQPASRPAPRAHARREPLRRSPGPRCQGRGLAPRGMAKRGGVDASLRGGGRADRLDPSGRFGCARARRGRATASP